jgi:uncharacterized membrane-anchored protein
MASPQIQQLRTQFNGMNTVQKKQFIDNLKVKLQGSNNSEYRAFLNECIQNYNVAVKSGVVAPQKTSAPANTATKAVSSGKGNKKKKSKKLLIIFAVVAVVSTFLSNVAFASGITALGVFLQISGLIWYMAIVTGIIIVFVKWIKQKPDNTAEYIVDTPINCPNCSNKVFPTSKACMFCGMPNKGYKAIDTKSLVFAIIGLSIFLLLEPLVIWNIREFFINEGYSMASSFRIRGWWDSARNVISEGYLVGNIYATILRIIPFVLSAMAFGFARKRQFTHKTNAARTMAIIGMAINALILLISIGVTIFQYFTI